MTEVRHATEHDSDFVREVLDGWNGPYIAVHGDLIDASALPALVAWQEDRRVGLLTYRDDERGCEIVTLNALVPGAGVGSALIEAVAALARDRGARTLWLVTTNDNTGALRFYQRRGFDLAAIHHDAVAAARALKPSIPAEGDGIPIRHELELRLDLRLDRRDLAEPA